MFPTLPRAAGPVSVVLYLAVASFAATAADAAAQDTTPPPVTVGRITISGFVQADALFTKDAGTSSDRPGSDEGESPDSFSVPRARVGLSGALTQKITWYLTGDFANLTSDGRVLRDAYMTFTANSQFAVRYGQMVAPFSSLALLTPSFLFTMKPWPS